VLSVAVSTDGKFVASGGRDNLVRIYDSRTNNEIKALSGHRDAVTCLAFKRDSPSLFSGSLDRCIKHWDLQEMGYLETLFGHQVINSSNFSCLAHSLSGWYQ
jgi:ribosomal RNA-processing protein 9